MIFCVENRREPHFSDKEAVISRSAEFAGDTAEKLSFGNRVLLIGLYSVGPAGCLDFWLRNGLTRCFMLGASDRKNDFLAGRTKLVWPAFWYGEENATSSQVGSLYANYRD